MKACPVGEKEKADINRQVEKILRGLGNPEPPLSLEDVRALLRLDRQYYSTTDDSVLREFVSKVKIGAQQLFHRPTLLWEVVKKADLSALWLPDPRRILIDRDLPELKHRWAESHEVAHSFTEWHKAFLFGDSKKELNPACHEVLEAEANYGAGQLLFLRDRFVLEAKDSPRNLKAIRNLAKRFGNTITSTLWRYIEELGTELPMVALVTGHPRELSADHDPCSPCKHFIPSLAFRERFSSVSEKQMFDALQQYCRRGRGPLGEAEVFLRDLNGDDNIFCFETFYNGHEALTLAYFQSRRVVTVAVA
jgi:hypothetical protein